MVQSGSDRPFHVPSEPSFPEPQSAELAAPTPQPTPDMPLPETVEAVVEEIDVLLAARVREDDTPVDEDLRRARAIEWAIRAERRHRFADEQAKAADEDVGTAHPPPSPPLPPHPAA